MADSHNGITPKLGYLSLEDLLLNLHTVPGYAFSAARAQVTGVAAVPRLDFLRSCLRPGHPVPGRNSTYPQP
ncbi:hypothetical protein TMatcc_004263 [Talaromyces marneffei ATCC 18224]